MPIYAQNTAVSTTASRIEIENLLKKWGAIDVISAPYRGKAAVVFVFQGKRVRFTASLPTEVTTPTGRRPRHPEKALEQAEREVWRLLLLKIKGKVASVGHDIDEFEVEFQPYFVTPDGRTIGEIMRPQIEAMYRDGNMPTGLLMLAAPNG